MIVSENRKRIVIYSRILKYFLMIMMFAGPVYMVGHWIFINNFSYSMLQDYAGVSNFTVGTNTQIYGAIATVLPASIMFFLLFYGFKLFRLYEQGKILTTKNVDCFRKIGYLLICKGITAFLMRPVYSIIFTMNNIPGKRSVSLSLSSEYISTIVGGLFIVVVAWVMDEAKKINDEIELTI